MYLERVRKAQEELRIAGYDIMLICDRENLIYYTGIPEIECGGLIIPAEGEPLLVTLWLDIPHIKHLLEFEAVGYVYGRDTMASAVARLISKMGYVAPKIVFSKYFVEVGVYETLMNNIPGMKVINGTELCYKIRAIKDEKEIEFITKASEMVRKGMEAAIDAIEPGMTESEVLGYAELAMRKAGSEGSPFRMQVLTKDRQLMTHPYATTTTIENNQPIVIHLGATYRGYVSKMCRTIALGQVSEETKKIYKIMVEAQQAAVKKSMPETPVKEVYNEAFKIIDENGYGDKFIVDIGYGIGIRQSEFYPIIGKNRDYILKENMVIDLMFPTIYDKEFGGPRVTDTLIVKNPPEILTKYSYDMVQK
ncbi:MAG TPA: aminopeptidase P family protein [Tissierellia bacterium]|nr:aminopeptidase P family protein [Tissierellia bacterium]